MNPLESVPLRSHPLRMVRYRLPQPEPEPDQSKTLLLRFLRPFGALAVRSVGRYLLYHDEESPLKELTDYYVMIDVESDTLSLWLLTSRRQLHDRYNVVKNVVPEFCPIFKGQMLENGEGLGYDVACIMDLAQRIGAIC